MVTSLQDVPIPDNQEPNFDSRIIVAMFIDSIPVDIVGGAYDIAANYLKQTGRIPLELDIHEPLFDSIMRDFRSGTRNKLRLANRAITRFEKTADVLELV